MTGCGFHVELIFHPSIFFLRSLLLFPRSFFPYPVERKLNDVGKRKRQRERERRKKREMRGESERKMQRKKKERKKKKDKFIEKESLK